MWKKSIDDKIIDVQTSYDINSLGTQTGPILMDVDDNISMRISMHNTLQSTASVY